MKIQDIRIGQVFYDNNGVKHTVTDIYSTTHVQDGKTVYTGTIGTEDGREYRPEDIRPVDGQPYAETDDYGNTSICLKTKAGIFVGSPDSGAHLGMYISVKLDNESEFRDLAAIRDTPVGGFDDKDIELLIFDDVFEEAPTTSEIIFHDDIKASC